MGGNCALPRAPEGDTTIAQGNWKADREVKQVTCTRESVPTVLTAVLFPCPLDEWDPQYIPQEQAWFKNEEGNFLPNGLWKFADKCIAVSESLALTSVKQFHEGTHSMRTALETTPPWLSIFMSPALQHN
jgi:hypothetical protein